MDVRLNAASPPLRQIRAAHRASERDESTPLRGRKQVADPSCQEKPRAASTRMVTVPQTDTGRWGENPKALVRTLVQELGKLAP